MGFAIKPTFIPHYYLPYTNLNSKFQKNLFIFAESKANEEQMVIHARYPHTYTHHQSTSIRQYAM
jgi:hypothetical protein